MPGADVVLIQTDADVGRSILTSSLKDLATGGRSR